MTLKPVEKYGRGFIMPNKWYEKVGEEEKPLFATKEEALKATGRIVLHYKGGVYRRLMRNVVHKNTDVMGVVYEHLHPHKHGYWYRPNDVFDSKTEDGLPRFVDVKPESEWTDQPPPDLETETNREEMLKQDGILFEEGAGKCIYRIKLLNVKHTEHDIAGVVCETLWPVKAGYFFIQDEEFFGQTDDGEPFFTEVAHNVSSK